MAHDQLLDHEYDGIQEYDNPRPGWWNAIFWLTVLFSMLVLPLLPRRHASGWTLAEAWKPPGRRPEEAVFGTMGDLKTDEHDPAKYMERHEWMLWMPTAFS